ncbi:MAG TPA: hypothetical protein VJ453_14890 [Terriglobales bacterium]|nr:hypothetical protein [Terriglobales bacterium]
MASAATSIKSSAVRPQKKEGAAEGIAAPHVVRAPAPPVSVGQVHGRLGPPVLKAAHGLAIRIVKKVVPRGGRLLLVPEKARAGALRGRLLRGAVVRGRNEVDRAKDELVKPERVPRAEARRAGAAVEVALQAHAAPLKVAQLQAAVPSPPVREDLPAHGKSPRLRPGHAETAAHRRELAKRRSLGEPPDHRA